MLKVIMMLSIFSIIGATLTGCGAGLNPGCKHSTPTGYCKIASP